MAVSKNKKVKQRENPKGKNIPDIYNPDGYIHEHPAWNFAACDNVMWSLSQENAGLTFWNEILPFMKSLEAITWQEILSKSNNKHHLINPNTLNKIAQNRLVTLHVEAEAIMSLRMTGTHRLYGYMEGAVFHILWYDTEHGDNDTCVCRSHLKHT